MSNDNNRAMIFGRNSLLTLPGRTVGVKTGTSDSFADAWTVGYTPHLVTAVWGGNADWRQKMTLNSDSYYIAAPMWHQFMQYGARCAGHRQRVVPAAGGPRAEGLQLLPAGHALEDSRRNETDARSALAAPNSCDSTAGIPCVWLQAVRH